MKRYNPKDNIMVVPSAQYPHMVTMSSPRYDTPSRHSQYLNNMEMPKRFTIQNRTAISIMSTITSLILKWRSGR